jgi:glycine cleavage system aminomethyltransferase T
MGKSRADVPDNGSCSGHLEKSADSRTLRPRTGASLKGYREWLPAAGYEGSASIGGSFASAHIEDYYFTPWDLTYGHLLKFDHDFIGREALERRAGDEHRQKVTLALDDADVTRTLGSMFQKNERGEVHRLAFGGLLDAPV